MTLRADSGSNESASVVLERLVDLACLLAFALVLARAVFANFLPGVSWAEAMLLVALCVSLTLSTARSRSLQTALLAAILIATVGGWLHAVGALTRLPFGSFTYGAATGAKLGGLLPWTIPLVWVVLVLSSRGTAEVLLRNRRGTPNYGLQAMGLTLAMALVLEAGLEVFARENGDWLWKRPEGAGVPGRVPLTALVGWLSATALVLVMATPFLLKKKPVRVNPDWRPLVIWIGLNAIFACAFF